MPDSEGRFRPIAVPRIPWHEEGGPDFEEQKALEEDLARISEDPDPPLDNERKVEEADGPG